MGNFASAETVVLPEISIVDEDGHAVAILRYSHDDGMKISSHRADIQVTLSRHNRALACNVLMEHASEYLADNKVVYVLSNFMPGREGFAKEAKEALEEKLKHLLRCLDEVSLTVDRRVI